jgi:hypothetical protein
VASFYNVLFARTARTAAGGGPAKLDAQVLATALAVYVTSEMLAGTTATSYDFVVTASGVGTRVFDVGTRGAAFGVADNSDVTAYIADNRRRTSATIFHNRIVNHQRQANTRSPKDRI